MLIRVLIIGSKLTRFYFTLRCERFETVRFFSFFLQSCNRIIKYSINCKSSFAWNVRTYNSPPWSIFITARIVWFFWWTIKTWLNQEPEARSALDSLQKTEARSYSRTCVSGEMHMSTRCYVCTYLDTRNACRKLSNYACKRISE